MVSDEKMIAALLSAPSIRAAANSLNISEGAIYKRLGDVSFRKEYNKQNTLLLDNVKLNLQSRLENAVNVMNDILTDENTPPQIRLNAAEALIRNSLKITKQTKLDTNCMTDILDEI